MFEKLRMIFNIIVGRPVCYRNRIEGTLIARPYSMIVQNEFLQPNAEVVPPWMFTSTASNDKINYTVTVHE